MSEDYVSFETAKLLKEKKFDEFCYYYYMEDGNLKLTNWDKEHNFCPCPTLQMAMKWLREIYKFEVRSTYCWDKDMWWGSINPMFDETDENSDIYQKALGFDYPGKSYEEACEAAIKYCLENLI